MNSTLAEIEDALANAVSAGAMYDAAKLQNIINREKQLQKRRDPVHPRPLGGETYIDSTGGKTAGAYYAP